jgi:hypothetical protein
MKFNAFLFLTFLFFNACAILSAQVPDSNFVQVLESDGRLNTGLRYEDLEVRFFSNGEESFVLQNSSLGLSLGGRLGWLRFSFTLPLADLETSNTNESKSFGLNLQFYRPNFYYEIRGQRFTGFQSQEVMERFRNDIRLWDVTLHGFKVHNPRLSLRAAFRNNQIQKQSQGSWLTALTINTQFLAADSIAILEKDNNNFTINRFNQFELGIMGGYAYTHLLSKNWYVTPLLIVGPEFRLLTYRGLEANESRKLFRIGPRFRARLAFGYNSEKMFASVTGYLLPGFATQNRLNTRVQDNQIRLRVGFRF